jgi:hypothetical protein
MIKNKINKIKMLILPIMVTINKQITIKIININRINMIMNKIRTSKMIIISKIINRKHMAILITNKINNKLVTNITITIIINLNRKLNFGRK